MKIYHKEIPNWITAVVGIGMLIIAFLTFVREEKEVSTRNTKEVGTQKIGDINNNQGIIVLHNETTNAAQNKKIIDSASGAEQDSRKRARVPEDGLNDSVENCTLPSICRNPINGPKVYSDPPKQNNCWLVTDAEKALHDHQFGAIIKFGQANIVQRCGDKIFTLGTSKEITYPNSDITL